MVVLLYLKSYFFTYENKIFFFFIISVSFNMYVFLCAYKFTYCCISSVFFVP